MSEKLGTSDDSKHNIIYLEVRQNKDLKDSQYADQQQLNVTCSVSVYLFWTV